MICSEIFSPPPVCRSEILRYAGCGEADDRTNHLLDACLQEAEAALTYRVCYTEAEPPPYGDLQACLSGSRKVTVPIPAVVSRIHMPVLYFPSAVLYTG